ncbi:hypothetical protein [Lacipirellula sp.]|uniref:hypothetical protein n=1 Tax=Lacipirellula sp. TaxID=2691419 RepID=UPI003D0FA29D
MIETSAVDDDYAAVGGAVCELDDAIERCGSCSTPVMLRRPSVSAPASPWLCRRCGSVFFARPQEKDGKLLRGVAKPICYHEVMRELNVHLGAGAQTASKRDVMRLVECFANRKFMGTDTRAQRRHIVAAPVTVIPLSGDLRITAPAERVLTLNVSGGGAALFHTRRIPQPYLAIDFTYAGVNLLPVVLETTRVRQVANSYEIAGRFVCRITP